MRPGQFYCGRGQAPCPLNNFQNLRMETVSWRHLLSPQWRTCGMTMCGRACASRRASPPLMAGPGRGPRVQATGTWPAALRAGGPASGMFMLAAAATMGSPESLSAPQALQCGPDRRSLQRSSQRGGRTCPSHSRWELDHAVRSLFF